MASILNPDKIVVAFDREEIDALRALLYAMAYNEKDIEVLRERLAPLDAGFGKGQLEILSKMNHSLSWDRIG